MGEPRLNRYIRLIIFITAVINATFAFRKVHEPITIFSLPRQINSKFTLPSCHLFHKCFLLSTIFVQFQLFEQLRGGDTEAVSVILDDGLRLLLDFLGDWDVLSEPVHHSLILIRIHLIIRNARIVQIFKNGTPVPRILPCPKQFPILIPIDFLVRWRLKSDSLMA